MATRRTIREKLSVLPNLLLGAQTDLEVGPINDVIEDLRISDQIIQIALEYAVELARQQGKSWAEIGVALHTTKQGAQQRYSPRPSPAVSAASEVLAGQLSLTDD